MQTVKLYRAGDLNPLLMDYYNRQNYLIDYFRPDKIAQGHTNAIFASGTLDSLKRWNGPGNIDEMRREWALEVNPNNVYAYVVKHFEDYQKLEWQLRKDRTDLKLLEACRDKAIEYWNSAIQLREWTSKEKKGELSAVEWEMLVPRKSIVNAILISRNDRPVPKFLQRNVSCETIRHIQSGTVKSHRSKILSNCAFLINGYG